MIDHINKTRSDHIITIEDPIEYVYQGRCSLIHQREVGADVRSFASALRSPTSSSSARCATMRRFPLPSRLPRPDTLS